MHLKLNDADTSFDVLFHNNPNPMWIVEVDTLLFKEINAAAIKHYGYSRDEFLNHITLAHIRPLEEHQSMKALIKRIKHSQTVKKELTHIKKDGTVMFVNITSYTVFYQGCHCRMVIINDITEQKRKDDKLKEALNRINETLESITDGFMTLYKKLRITYYNSEAERILLLNREQALHKKFGEIDQLKRPQCLHQRIKQALIDKETIKFEEYIEPLNKWICATVYPGKDGLAIYFQDVTSQKYGEEQIDLKNKSLDNIAYMNSHLIRKPLANILGIINSFDDDDLRDCSHIAQPLKMLKSSALELDRIIRLINNSVEKVNK
jgi:PAS domain S-box-containing protein